MRIVRIVHGSHMPGFVRYGHKCPSYTLADMVYLGGIYVIVIARVLGIDGSKPT